MAMKEHRKPPQQGKRVWLAGNVVMVVDAIHGPQRVVVQLDAAPAPIMIEWKGEPDDESIVYFDGDEPADLRPSKRKRT